MYEVAIGGGKQWQNSLKEVKMPKLRQKIDNTDRFNKESKRSIGCSEIN